MKASFRILLVFFLMILLCGLNRPPAVRAAPITVDTLADENDGVCSVGGCSLREAIAAAAAGDTITFSVTGVILLTHGQITIGKNLLINGPGASSLTINGQDNSKILRINSGVTATLSGVTIANGYTSGGSGGGIDNRGTLTVTNVTFSANAAYFGGAIYNEGTLSITDSTFSANRAYQGYGAAVHNYGHGTTSNLTVTRCTFTNNIAQKGNGAGIYGGGTISVTGSTFTGNQANVGSAISSWGASTVTDSTFTGNTASDRGIINNSAGSLIMNTSTFSGNHAVYGSLHNDGTAAVTGSTFTNNDSDNPDSTGGGIDNHDGHLNVSNSTFSGNHAVYGGGIYNSAGSELVVTGSAFLNNSAAGETYGGGIDNEGALSVTNSTFSGNSATYGGGIGNWGSMSVTNSTLVSNSATEGGGIYTGTGKVATVKNTLVANSSQGGNCRGALSSGGTKNLSTDATCAPGFTQATVAQLALGALTGIPAYYPLQFGSVAIDKGANSDCPAVDQRGVARPLDGDGDTIAICDIGAYEYDGPLSHRVFLPHVQR